jgi:hypothetical protein
MVDRYTKAVLTVIVVCLAIIAARDLPFSRTASAQGDKMHAVLDEVAPFAFQFATVPVKLKN